MATTSTFAFLFISILILFSSNSVDAFDIDFGIGIGIGVGGGKVIPPPSDSPDCSPPPPLSSPPSPSPSLPPPPSLPRRQPPTRRQRFESKGIENAYHVIQSFKSKIENDPLKVLATWKGADVCKYKGIRCDKLPDKDRKRSVSGLSFNNFNFSGSKLTLHGLIDQLPDLTFFHANSNFFAGDVPAGIAVANLRFLYELDLSNNEFAGKFPGEILGATNLTFLDIRFNKYFGPVRPELFDMDINSAIFLNNNKFSGCIPENIGNTSARYLTLTSNELIGPIPKSIGTGKAKDTLIEVLFSNNKLSGCLPMEIGLLKNTILFDASHNFLTGPIPLSFTCLSKMELLNFANNRLYGVVPDPLCKLPNLRNLILQNNFFTQLGPACRNLIKRNVLDVSGNCILNLPNQRPEKECKAFASNIHKYPCSDEKAMKFVPCLGKKNLQRAPPLVRHRRPPRKMRTYAALVPH